MQIYSKSMKNATSIQKSQQICTWGGDVYYASRNLLSTCFFWGGGGGWLMYKYHLNMYVYGFLYGLKKKSLICQNGWTKYWSFNVLLAC